MTVCISAGKTSYSHLGHQSYDVHQPRLAKKRYVFSERLSTVCLNASPPATVLGKATTPSHYSARVRTSQLCSTLVGLNPNPSRVFPSRVPELGLAFFQPQISGFHEKVLTSFQTIALGSYEQPGFMTVFGCMQQMRCKRSLTVPSVDLAP